MRWFAIVFAFFLSGCASQIMQSYLGKDITEAAMDYGVPDATMDLPDGRRAFMWQMTQNIAMPQTTTYNATATGNWVNGTATTSGGIASQTCNYTLIGQRNSKGSYTVVDFRKPSMMCE
ncbi:hypothetical protein [Paracoccus sp. 22332]|uniref:hypothetical protein n=1 Tax=Paracoccus sp. 22332 TaxID=3453913 RepID=UPI003F86E6E0